MASDVRPLDPNAFTFYGFGSQQERIAAHIGNALLRFDEPVVSVVEDALFIPAVKRQAAGQPDYAGGVVGANGDVIEAAQLRRGRDKLVGGLAGPVAVVPERELDVDVIYLGWLSAHFGRVLLESLARVWALSTLDPALRVVFHHVNGARRTLPDWLPPLLAAFGIPSPRLLTLPEPTRVRRLLLPEPLFQQHYLAHMAMAHPFREVATRIAGAAAPSAQPVYLSRRRLSSRQRSIVGEDEVELLLRENGFRIAYPEQLSLDEQIRLINEHADIFTTAGSAAHNVLFACGRPSLHLLTTEAGPPINYCLCSALAQAPTTLVNCLTTGGRPNVKRQQATPVVVELPRLIDYLVERGFVRHRELRRKDAGSRQRRYDETWLYARLRRSDRAAPLPTAIEQEAIRLAATSWPLSLILAWRLVARDAARAARMAEQFVALAAAESDPQRIAFYRTDVMRMAPRIGRRCDAPLEQQLTALAQARFAVAAQIGQPRSDRALPASSETHQEFIVAGYRDATGQLAQTVTSPGDRG